MINRRQLRKFMITLAVTGGVLLMVCLGLLFCFWPRPAWIIEDRHVKTWEKIIAASPSILPKAKIIPVSAAESRMSRSWYGYRIDSKQQPRAAVEDESPIRVYRRFRSETYGEFLPLALDPWLVFRKFTSSPLIREEAENGSGGNDRVLLAGGDRAAVMAWIAQLVQETPGVFSRDETLWEQTETRFLRGDFFQRGAMTYGWNELWPVCWGEMKT